MRIIDVGTGPPVVVVPGIQGRWEWHRRGIDALARRCRVITFSLADEPTSAGRFDPAAGFTNYVEQVREAMDQAGLEAAAVFGISYGGLIASAFAAAYPSRTTSLVLASALPPSWRPDARVRTYLRTPRLLSPLFCVGSLRMYPEFAAATTGHLAGILAAMRHARNALAHIFSPTRMARRVRLLEGEELVARLAGVQVPTLVVTGDTGLDRVVPVSLTLEYLSMWPHAQSVTIARTGHLGFVTKPDEFTRLVAPFLESAAGTDDSRRRVG